MGPIPEFQTMALNTVACVAVANAIYLASALSINDGALVMVTYDARLREASLRVGVRVEAPGV